MFSTLEVNLNNEKVDTHLFKFGFNLKLKILRTSHIKKKKTFKLKNYNLCCLKWKNNLLVYFLFYLNFTFYKTLKFYDQYLSKNT